MYRVLWLTVKHWFTPFQELSQRGSDVAWHRKVAGSEWKHESMNLKPLKFPDSCCDVENDKDPRPASRCVGDSPIPTLRHSLRGNLYCSVAIQIRCSVPQSSRRATSLCSHGVYPLNFQAAQWRQRLLRQAFQKSTNRRPACACSVTDGLASGSQTHDFDRAPVV